MLAMFVFGALVLCVHSSFSYAVPPVMVCVFYKFRVATIAIKSLILPIRQMKRWRHSWCHRATIGIFGGGICQFLGAGQGRLILVYWVLMSAAISVEGGERAGTKQSGRSNAVIIVSVSS